MALNLKPVDTDKPPVDYQTVVQIRRRRIRRLAPQKTHSLFAGNARVEKVGQGF
jgi:hypothetical protein